MQRLINKNRISRSNSTRVWLGPTVQFNLATLAQNHLSETRLKLFRAPFEPQFTRYRGARKMCAVIQHHLARRPSARLGKGAMLPPFHPPGAGKMQTAPYQNVYPLAILRYEKRRGTSYTHPTRATRAVRRNLPRSGQARGAGHSRIYAILRVPPPPLE